MVRNLKKGIICGMCLMILATSLYGCTKNEVNVNCTVTGTKYEHVLPAADVNAYAAEVFKNGENYNGPLEQGIVICPYYTLSVNGTEIPVYTTRCGKSLHSFAYVDVAVQDAASAFILNAELTALSEATAIRKKDATVTVLPEKRGVEAAVADGKVTAAIHAFGSFTFTFNGKPEEALTLYVAEEEPFAVPEGYAVQRLEPAKHSLSDTTFQQTETVYYFAAGRHLIDSISLPDHSVLYLERGAYLEAYADGEGAHLSVLRSFGTSNVRIEGRGAFDFSALMGGDAKLKGAFSFDRIDGAVFRGITSINSQTWTLCFTDCENVKISASMLFGFRTYSDGIMLSDCRNSTVTQCFVRTGDDAMETKSTSVNGYTDNVVYRDNDCWTDKGLGYGVVWEANHDTKNVWFVDCSVGFAQSNWDARLGALAIQLGDHNTRDYDIHFENIEIYRCESQAVINCEIKEKGRIIEDIYFRNIACRSAVGYLFRLAEVDIQNGGKFGKFYLDNVSKNGVALTPENRNDKYMMQLIIATPGWNADRNIMINTLQSA